MKITPGRPFRVNRDGQSVQCDGFMIEIYDSKEKKNAVDIIYAAVGYELLENDIHEAEQLAKDYIDSEKLELRKISDEEKLNLQICSRKCRLDPKIN